MRRKHLKNVTPGMVLGKTIYGDKYEVLLRQGVLLTARHIEALEKRGQVCIYIEDEETEGIGLDDMISEKVRTTSTKNIIDVYNIAKSSLAKERLETYEEIIKRINTEKFKKSFQESYEFKQLKYNIKSFLAEILNRDVLIGLNTIKTYDNYIYEHSMDAAIISLVLAKKLRLKNNRLQQIVIGEFLHDIGMIFIDEVIQKKPDTLTAAEYELVKQHPKFGYELLMKKDEIGYVAAHIAYQHHERQDGSGYPRGLRGKNTIDYGEINYTEEEKLILPAEISAVADFYDACISDRPFRPALPHDLVYELIKDGIWKKFNKEVVDCFLSITPKYLVGSEIKIKNGEYKDFTGFVTSINKFQLNKPTIRLLYDSEKKKIAPFEIDLSSERKMIDMQCIV
ncbi:MAG: HD domain-containing protein [Candidatus Brocadiaceae bacterium]|nr:HD domain-containing protein [Candidatus Brocadiaceae bacterium]